MKLRSSQESQKMKIEFSDEAKLDISESYQWYESQQPDLGERFLVEVKQVTKRISTNPESFRKFYSYREARLNKFPFLVLYKIFSDKIIVLAIFHTSKSPIRKP